MYALIFYDQLRREAQRGDRVSQGTLLGFVILHELGHLMGLSHSREGVMIGNWGTHEMQLMGMRAFRFSASECQQMQAEVAARSSALGAKVQATGARSSSTYSPFFPKNTIKSTIRFE
jgi:hypothetical protein